MAHGRITRDQLLDVYQKAEVTRHDRVYAGRVWDVVQEDFTHDGETLTRDFVQHPGAVAVLALRGESGEGEVLVIQQYRHPIGAKEWEIPAGLLDVSGEPPHEAATRELFEEADVRAGRIEVLLDYASSPGGLSEQLRIFLARDVTDVPENERFEREAEEVNMPTAWVRLDDVVSAALAGQIHNPTLMMAAFAASAARANSWRSLRPADVPWPIHPAFANGH